MSRLRNICGFFLTIGLFYVIILQILKYHLLKEGGFEKAVEAFSVRAEREKGQGNSRL